MTEISRNGRERKDAKTDATNSQATTTAHTASLRQHTWVHQSSLCPLSLSPYILRCSLGQRRRPPRVHAPRRRRLGVLEAVKDQPHRPLQVKRIEMQACTHARASTNQARLCYIQYGHARTKGIRSYTYTHKSTTSSMVLKVS